MGTVIIWVLGLSGYLLLPSLIWGWVVWSKSRPRFNSPKWRYVAAFAGLVLASLVGLSALFVIVYSGNVRVEARYEFAMKSCGRGIVASVIALALIADRERSDATSSVTRLSWVCSVLARGRYFVLSYQRQRCGLEMLRS